MLNQKTKSKRSNKIGITFRDRVFYIIVDILLAIFFLIVLGPCINIVASSFSDADAVGRGEVILLPVQPTLEGYNAVFTYKGIWLAYAMTAFYTIAGTILNLVFTLAAAYPMARRNLPLKKPVVMLFMFTMLFSGGMIPSYILLKDLRMLDTVWSMLLPGLISVYNLIVCRTFIQGIPADIEEAAKIDGCSDFRYFFSMVLPLSGTVIAVLSLYYAVGHWNDYFDAWLYLSDPDLYPLQIILRAILIQNSFDPESVTTEENIVGNKSLQDLLKYSLIIVSSVPVLCAYPFVKRFFMKGVMLGAVKG